MSRKRVWRRVLHGGSTPFDASKSERTRRRLSKCLCNEEEFDEMKRTCAYCGMFEDEDDISVARGQIAACVQSTVNYLECSTDVVLLLWATQEGHRCRIAHGATCSD